MSHVTKIIVIKERYWMTLTLSHDHMRSQCFLSKNELQQEWLLHLRQLHVQQKCKYLQISEFLPFFLLIPQVILSWTPTYDLTFISCYHSNLVKLNSVTLTLNNHGWCCSYQLSRSTTNPTKRPVHPGEDLISLGIYQVNDLCAQWRLISLGICPVWSESFLCTQDHKL